MFARARHRGHAGRRRATASCRSSTREIADAAAPQMRAARRATPPGRRREPRYEPEAGGVATSRCRAATALDVGQRPGRGRPRWATPRGSASTRSASRRRPRARSRSTSTTRPRCRTSTRPATSSASPRWPRRRWSRRASRCATPSTSSTRRASRRSSRSRSTRSPRSRWSGETEETCREKGIDLLRGPRATTPNARGQIIGDLAGHVKLSSAPTDQRLLGVHVIGETRVRARPRRP